MTLNTWIIVRERWAEGPRYFTDMSGKLSVVRESAMQFTSRALAWRTAEEFRDWTDGNIRVVPKDGSYGA